MPYTAMTLADLRERLRDRYESKPFWDSIEARLVINETLYFWNLCTGRWRGREVISTVTSLAHLYTVPCVMLYRTRITFNGYPLQSSSREDLYNARRTWRTESTTSGSDVPTRPVVWAPVSLNAFYLWPADAVGSPNRLTIDGVAATPVLVEDGDTLDLGDDTVSVLLGYALHVLAFKKGGSFFASTTPLYQAFLAAAAEENGQIKTSQMYRRVMGLDHRGMKPLRGTPTLLDAVAGH